MDVPTPSIAPIYKMSTYSERRLKFARTKFADVQVEMTRQGFDNIMSNLVFGTLILIGPTFLIAQYYRDDSLFVLLCAMLITSLARIVVASRYNLRKHPHMSAESADMWEIAYGCATCLCAAALAASTLYSFSNHSEMARNWCILGTFAFCGTISSRPSFQTWIARTCGVVALAALALSLALGTEVLVFRLSAFLVALPIAIYWKSIGTRYRDSIDRIRASRKLTDLEEHDSLTGLANRSYFEAHLAAACKLGQPFAVLYIDLDKFKAVNDSWGNPTGDSMLREVAQRLRAGTRGEDLIARIGGDEFAILQAAPVDQDSARELAARINRKIAAPFSIFGNDVKIAASIGVRLSEKADTPDAQSLLRNVDRALHLVKKEGGGSFYFA